jgi:hypothetical protein
MQRIDRYVVHLSVLDRTQRNAGISSALGKSAREPQAQKPSLISFPVPLRASADSTFAGWLAYRQRCNPRCEYATLPEKAPNGRVRRPGVTPMVVMVQMQGLDSGGFFKQCAVA